ncbi:MAG: hypothetical protein SOX97_07285 [Sutterella sp.]|nr:hypothetical protein [Sutterella sp.]
MQRTDLHLEFSNIKTEHIEAGLRRINLHRAALGSFVKKLAPAFPPERFALAFIPYMGMPLKKTRGTVKFFYNLALEPAGVGIERQ